MATRNRAPESPSNTTPIAPTKRIVSGILPNLPIQFSGRLLANAKPQSLADRGGLFQAGDVADGCYLLDQGPLKVRIPSPSSDEQILTIHGPGSIVWELSTIAALPRV